MLVQARLPGVKPWERHSWGWHRQAPFHSFKVNNTTVADLHTLRFLFSKVRSSLPGFQHMSAHHNCQTSFPTSQVGAVCCSTGRWWIESAQVKHEYCKLMNLCNDIASPCISCMSTILILGLPGFNGFARFPDFQTFSLGSSEPRLRIGRQATDATDATDATCSGDARRVLPETAGDSWNGPLGQMGGEKRGQTHTAFLWQWHFSGGHIP